MNWGTILLVAALVVFVADACGVQSKVKLTPLGLACWVLSILIA